MRLKCAITYLLLFCFALCRAQSIQFNRLAIEDGLSQNSVLAVCQDKDGFIWLGTRAGLNKYDSYNFKVYRNQPADTAGLYTSYITALTCDAANHLWIGTSGGLNIYDRTLDKFKRVNLPLKNINDENRKRINALLTDRSGRLWVASEFNLNLVSVSQGKISVTPVPLPEGKIMLRSLFQDNTGIIWLGTAKGVYQVTESGKQFIIKKFDAADAAGLANTQVLSVTQDAGHNIWIGTTGKGLLRYNTVSKQITQFTALGNNSLGDDNIRRLLPDGKGNLWIGTQNGISVLNLATGSFSNYRNNPWDEHSLSQNSIHSLYKDNAGTVWIGTFFGGVNRVYPYPAPFTVLSNRSFTGALNNNVISSVIKDENDNLWIGTEGGGINVVDGISGKINTFQHSPANANSLGSNLVKVIYKDNSGSIWVGTHSGGLNLYNPATKSFTRYLNDKQITLGSEITCVMQDSQNRLWVGTETAGLNIFERKGVALIPITNAAVTQVTQSRSVLGVIQASDGTVWAGGPDGLYITNTRGQAKVIKHLKANQQLSVNTIFEDNEGHIWVGTNTSGLARFAKNQRLLARYATGNGLSDNKVLGILQNDNELWISTGNGLNRLNIKTGKINHYTEADGIAGNVFNNNSYYKANDGQMFFGGYNGLTSFYPHKININQQIPVARLTSLSVHNKAVTTAAPDGILPQNISLSKQITLNYNQNVFTLRFAVLNFIKPKKNRYQYYLEGYDKNWQHTDVPAATYTNVPPGNYHFYIKGSNNDNVWSRETVLDVSIRPPFWKTWWAYLFYFLFAAGLVVLLVRYVFIRALYKKEQELTRLKLNFFTNISHEIRTHLALIIGPTDRLMADNESPVKGKQQLITIKNNSESLLQLINELLDFRKVETGHLSLRAVPSNLISFIETIGASFDEIAIEKNITYTIQHTTKYTEVYLDSEQLEKVFYNLLHNAFKFTPNGGSITVDINDNDGFVSVDVINSGPGISKENIDKLFDNYFQEVDYGKQNTGYGIGLALSKSIVELHKGSIGVKSVSIGEGDNLTTFTVTLLKGSAHFLPGQLQAGKSLQTTIAPAPVNMAEPVREEFTNTPAYADDDIFGDEKPTVLIVEDNLEIRKFIRETLQPKYNITEAGHGIEGFELAVFGIPDLIISDVMMPEMDGLTFCSKIKTDERTSHIPVILLTAKNTVQQHIDGLQTGADIYLTKPFSIDILMLQVNNLLRARELMWARFDRKFKQNGVAASLPEDVKTDKQAAQLHPLDEAFLNRLTGIVNDNLTNRNFGVQLLSQMAGMSQPVLFRKIKGITGISANDFVKSLRLKRAAELLLEKHYNVSEISTIVGYESSKYFSREFKKYYGVNPSEYEG